MTTNATDIAIVGGGLAGLVAARTCADAGVSVTVYERHRMVGGQARSVDRDGFTFNHGPHALYEGGEAFRVLSAMGVHLAGGQPPGSGGLVLDSRVHRLPAGPGSLLTTRAFTLRDRVQAAKLFTRLPSMDAAASASLSVAAWLDQLGLTGNARATVEGFVRLATYVGDSSELSADVAISQLQMALSSGVRYLDGGWQAVVDQLRNDERICFVEDASVDELPDARAVIVAVGGPAQTSKLTGVDYAVGPAAEVSCLDLGLARRPTHDFLLGGDQPTYFSNHSAHARLAPAGQCHATALQYLRAGDEPRPQLLAELVRHAGIADEDVLVTRSLHRLTACSAIATAVTGGRGGRPATTASGASNVFVAGDWVGPTGHLADASVASAVVAAQHAVKQVAQSAKVPVQ